MKAECQIVRDLMPAYAEALASPETRGYVEEHISDCVDCKRSLQRMQTILGLPSLNLPLGRRQQGIAQAVKKRYARYRRCRMLLVVIFLLVGLAAWFLLS